MSEQITVLVFEPGQPGVTREIGNDLAALQAVVGGYIEVVHPPDLPAGMCLVCNEEGQLRDLPRNRRVPGVLALGGYLRGTFFVTREEGEEFASLTEADVAAVTRLAGGWTPALNS